MNFWQRLAMWWTPRADAAPLALPGPAPEALVRRRDSVINGLTGLGSSSDKGAIARPNTFATPLTDDELRALYTHNGMARKIVDYFPTRATRKGWVVPDVGDEDRRLQTWERVTEAMRWARLHGGSIIVPITEDNLPPAFRRDPWKWLQQPLDLRRVGRVAALQVFDAFEAVPVDRDRDPRSPTFRLPRMWHVSTDGFAGYIHGSRVVYFRGARRPPSELWGGFGRSNRMPDDSCLQAIWDEIRRLTETMAGGAVLAQELRESVLKIGDLDALLTADEGALFDRRISDMARSKALLGMVLLGPGDEYTSRSNPPTGFDQLSNAAKSMLAAVADIPEIELFGSTPGGLGGPAAGDSGHESSRQAISDYQEQHRPHLQQLYGLVYAAEDGPTNGRPPEGWDVEFLPLDEPGEADKAAVRKVVAEIDSAYIKAGVLLPEDIREHRFGADGWVLDLPELEALEEPDEDALERARREVEAGMAEPEDDELVEDAADGCLVLVPAADPGLRAAVEAAIGQVLVVEDEPHVTLLYVGKGLDEAAVAEVVAGATEEARVAEACVLERGMLRSFAHGPHGTPIVVEFDAWPLDRLQGALLRRLAHVVVARQHRSFRPHLTVGYAPAPLSPEATARLLEVDATKVRVAVGELRVKAGEAVVATVPVGS